MSEIDLVNSLIDFLQKNEFKTWKEVPNMGQSVDLVAQKHNKLTFIEAKIKDWSKAINQCRAHELVADYIYIAIATKKVSEYFKEQAKFKGYGIIHFDICNSQCNYILEPQENIKVWQPQQEVLKRNLKKLTYGS